MSFHDLIVNAIRTRRCMRINYKGEGYRTICPHIMFLSSKGNKLVDSYQVDGYSEHHEDVPGWRPFDVSKITECMLLDDDFEIADGYNPDNSKRYITIIERVR